MWRGAYPKAFMSIWDREDFSKKFMRDNFRSCQQIQNYSNLLCDETRDLYKAVDDLSSVIVICTTMSNWVASVTQHLDPHKKCALLRYSKANAETGAKALTDGDMEFTIFHRHLFRNHYRCSMALQCDCQVFHSSKVFSL